MPVLHAYRSKEGHYVLAGVKGKIVTYRLSPEGVRRLHDSGYDDDANFKWALLLELIHGGHAYTGKIKDDEGPPGGWEQPELPLFISQHEPAPTDPVPCCACGSLEVLHIVGLASDHSARILCDACQTQHREYTAISVPIYMITTPAALERLLDRSGLTGDDTVASYRDLLSLNLEAKFRARVRPKRATVRNPLFPVPDEPQGSLL
jgi:hypothetical protein